MNSDIYLLNIHTTGETAIVNLCREKIVLDTKYNHQFKEHGSFLHTAIEQLLADQELSSSDLKAIGVTHGPGSYTGIRVGLAAAKGLSFSLNIPLITLNTLEVMAAAAIAGINEAEALYCPMIDARRMEVYTALYRFDRTAAEESKPVIVDESFFKKYTGNKKVYFFGSGSYKFKQIISGVQPNVLFKDLEIDTHSLAELSYEKFHCGVFSDLAFSEPLYLKEFVSTSKK